MSILYSIPKHWLFFFLKLRNIDKFILKLTWNLLNYREVLNQTPADFDEGLLKVWPFSVALSYVWANNSYLTGTHH